MATLISARRMFVLLWVLLIRPQRQRQQEQQTTDLVGRAGRRGADVGGIYGIVRDIDEEDDLIVEIAEGIPVQMPGAASAAVVQPDEDDDDEDARRGRGASERRGGRRTPIVKMRVADCEEFVKEEAAEGTDGARPPLT